MRKQIADIEEKITDYLLDHSDQLFFVIITILSILIRFGLFPIISNDAQNFLLPWYDEIKQNGGLHALSRQTGDYCIFYQTLIALFTYLPLQPLTAYKILSCTFDYILAVGCMFVAKELTHRRTASIWAYAVVLCSPIVVLNAAAWAQCDAMYAALCVWSIYFCLTDRFSLMFIAYGIACTMKLQAVFLLPFLLFFHVTKKSFSIMRFFYIPATMILFSFAGILQGRKLWDVLLIYANQVHSYNSYLTSNYPGIWALFSIGSKELNPFYSRSLTLLALCILGMIFYYVLKKFHAPTKEQLLSISFILVYAAVLTMPRMHERYGFLYEVLALIIAVVNKRTIPACILLQMITFCTYSNYLMGEAHDLRYLAVANIGVFVYYFGILLIRYSHKES